MAFWAYWQVARRLRSDDVRERREAVRELVEDHDPRAAKLLVSALKDDNVTVRNEATLILGGRRLKSDNGDTRDKAARAIGQVATTRAARALWKARERISCEVLEDSLTRVGSPALEVLCAALRSEACGDQCVTARGTKVAEPWRDAPGRYERRIAARVLGRIKDPDAVPALAEALDDPRSLELACLVEIIAALHPLGFKPASARQKTLFALEAGHPRRAVRDGASAAPLLVSLLRAGWDSYLHKYRDLGEEAALALAELPAELCRATVRAVVESKPEHLLGLDVDLAYCLARHGDAAARASLEKKARDLIGYPAAAAVRLAVLGDFSAARSIAAAGHRRHLEDLAKDLERLLTRHAEIVPAVLLRELAGMKDWHYTESETPAYMQYAGAGMDWPDTDREVTHHTWDCSRLRELAASALVKPKKLPAHSKEIEPESP